MPYVQLNSGTVLETDDVSRWPEAKRLTKVAGKKALRDESIEHLRGYLKPGDTVHCVLRHVSRSGMSRNIDFYKLGADGPQWLSGWIANVCDYSRAKDGSLRVEGAGMDMGFSVVYHLSATLFRKGFDCIGKGCPSNDHSNGDRNYEPHRHAHARWLRP